MVRCGTIAAVLVGVLACAAVVVGSAQVAATPSAGTRPHTRPASLPNDPPFVVVFIDSTTEQKFGPFPYDRRVYADAVERATAGGAAGVVIKYFLDRPKTPEGDAALARAMGGTKVVLQARLDDEEPRPNPLPERFTLAAPIADGLKPPTGARGWLPLPQLSAPAADVGFIDHRVIDRVALVERYRDQYVKSLYVCCLELALNADAAIVPGKVVRFGDRALKMDDRCEVPVRFPEQDRLAYVPLVDFLQPRAEVDLKAKWSSSRTTRNGSSPSIRPSAGCGRTGRSSTP